MSKTVKVKHPVFKDISKEVSKDEVAAYAAAGWLESSQRRKATVNTNTDAAVDETSPATDEGNTEKEN